MTLDTTKRAETIARMRETAYDLLVIGGGITGAGIAMDAATRGLKVGLVEMQDFGSGTSSRSTKLIHGGLRYLKQLEIALVREVGQERAILFKNAPNLVVPEKMLLPITERGSLGKYATSMGLFVYEQLAGVPKDEQRKMLSVIETLKAEPLLEQEGLEGGGLYYEYRTDDARLTIEVMKTAVIHGADCLNYVQATRFLNTDGKVTGIEAKDLLTDTTFELSGKTVINATGPWVDTLREKADGLGNKRLHPTKGVHLVVPYMRLPLRQAAYFDTEDGRMIFAIPRDNITYIGTTDTSYTGSLTDPQTTAQDVQYLLDAVNAMFPSAKLTAENVESSWSGVRPLIHEKGKSPSELSRKDEIFVSKSGVISIAGGKLTGFRKMAERAVDRAYDELKKMGLPYAKCKTSKVQISGGRMPEGREAFRKQWQERSQQEGWEEHTVDRLVRYYGSNITQIMDLGTENGKVNWLLGEVRYAVRNEGVTNLEDLLIRRNGRLYFDRGSISLLRESYLEALANELGWSKEEIKKQNQAFESAYQEVVRFD